MASTKPTTSQTTLCFIVQLAAETFDTPEQAQYWLDKPHPLLGDVTPRQMTETATGAEKVMSLLAAIRYGGVA